MEHIYIFAGHNIKSNGIGTGAFYRENGKVAWHDTIDGKRPVFDEAVEARKFVIAVAKELYKNYNIMTITDGNEWAYQRTVLFASEKAKRNSLVIDVHFNASSNPEASGTEVLIPSKWLDARDTENEKILGHRIANATSSILDIPLRGGAKTGYLGVKYSNESQHSSIAILDKIFWGTNLLLEICFITNKQDMINYKKRFNTLVQSVAAEIANYVNGNKIIYSRNTI